MRIDASLVAHVARLAALEVTPGEAAELSGELTRIVEHFEALQGLPDDLLAEPGTAFATPLRADVARAARPAVLETNAPESAHGHFVVPRVVSRGE
ncbi:MAG: Asp-tRNA(Asn)/Glu-tRNA(Gln) amidotransferase GatCAB subunit C [Acidobacteria bacterium]|nr:Asp-tRNA(Asn)/Glu-tRNA(Gln) amidotransferase GatCAB subunit C [Acidobacteriota bacterium]